MKGAEMLPEKVMNYLQEAARTAKAPLPERETSLFRSGLLDSFALVDFVALLEDVCGIRVPDSQLRPENFDTIAKIETFVARTRRLHERLSGRLRRGIAGTDSDQRVTRRATRVEPAWIEANSGIRERRWVEAHQSTSDLAAAAVADATNDAGINAAQLDYLIGGTLSPDYQVPGVAPLVQHKLAGCRAIPALDVRAGCAAALYSLQLAAALIDSRAAETIACFGAEAQSKGLRLDRASAELSMLFGDGAGAVIVSRAPSKMGTSIKIEDVLISSDGAFAEDLIVRAPGLLMARAGSTRSKSIVVCTKAR
jgi:acyl carrier protein